MLAARLCASGLAVLAFVLLAIPAQAANQLYDGKITVNSFGNDKALGPVL